MTIRLNHLDVARTYAEGGITLKECGEMFGCSNMTVQRVLKRMGVARKVGGNRGVPQDPKTGRFTRHAFNILRDKNESQGRSEIVRRFNLRNRDRRARFGLARVAQTP